MHVDAAGVEIQAVPIDFSVIEGDEQQVDVGLGPNGIVGEASTQHGGENRAILLHLLDEFIESGVESVPDLSGRSRRPAASSA